MARGLGFRSGGGDKKWGRKRELEFGDGFTLLAFVRSSSPPRGVCVCPSFLFGEEGAFPLGRVTRGGPGLSEGVPLVGCSWPLDLGLHGPNRGIPPNGRMACPVVVLLPLQLYTGIDILYLRKSPCDYDLLGSYISDKVSVYL